MFGRVRDLMHREVWGSKMCVMWMLAAVILGGECLKRERVNFGAEKDISFSKSQACILDCVKRTDIYKSSQETSAAQPAIDDIVDGRETALDVAKSLWSVKQLLEALERSMCPKDDAKDDDLCDGVEWPTRLLSLVLTTQCATEVEAVVSIYSADDQNITYDYTSRVYNFISDNPEENSKLVINLKNTDCYSIDVRHIKCPVTRMNSLIRKTTTQLHTAAEVEVQMKKPKAIFYKFKDGENHVRLILQSEDGICASVFIKQFVCSAQGIDTDRTSNKTMTISMTMSNSSATQVSRDMFPKGFYVVVVVRDNDEPCYCNVDKKDTANGLCTTPSPKLRIKKLKIVAKPVLTYWQYLVAELITVLVFTIFYLAFFASLLARRWEPFEDLVKPVTVNYINDLNEDPCTECTMIATPPQTPSSTAPDLGTFRPTHTSILETPLSTATDHSTVDSAVPKDPTNGIPHKGADGVDSRDADGTDGRSAGGAAEACSTPFGLPREPRVCHLLPRSEGERRARSDRYLYTLLTVAVFYSLPVMQFVAAFQIIMNVSGSLDVCYYNFLCAHPAGGLSDFNHVFSNIGYLMLGGLFVLQVQLRRARRKSRPRHKDYGLPEHYGILTSLGVCMMMVAVLSATYHVCPNQLNFQFDTAFMYVLAVLCMVKVYQSRHPDVNASAQASFGVLAVTIATVVWGVLGGDDFFWVVFTILHILAFMLLSFQIYYLGKFRLGKEQVTRAARELRLRGAQTLRPMYTARLTMLLIANAANWIMAFIGYRFRPEFAEHMLKVLLGNALLYMIFYLVMKRLHHERQRWYTWCWLVGAIVTWAPALYYFVSVSTDWAAPAAVSRNLNHECKLLQFYDNHDLWHIFSAIALYFSFNLILTWDDGLAAVRNEDIPVF